MYLSLKGKCAIEISDVLCVFELSPSFTLLNRKILLQQYSDVLKSVHNLYLAQDFYFLLNRDNFFRVSVIGENSRCRFMWCLIFLAWRLISASKSPSFGKFCVFSRYHYISLSRSSEILWWESLIVFAILSKIAYLLPILLRKSRFLFSRSFDEYRVFSDSITKVAAFFSILW